MFSTEYKRSRQEIKRKSSDTMKLQKKARKGEDEYYCVPLVNITVVKVRELWNYVLTSPRFAYLA